MKLNLILLVVVAFAALSFSAKAQVITEVTGKSAFDTAVTNPTVDDFESLGVTPGSPGPGNVGYKTYNTYTDAIGSFYDSFSESMGNPNGVYVVESDATGNPVGYGDGSVFMVNNSNGAVTFTAASGYSAIGANFFAVASTSNDVPFTVVATSTTDSSLTITKTFTLDLPAATAAPSSLFVGFLAPEGYDITTIDYPIVEDGNGPGIDNFTGATTLYPITVPEPASIGLVMIGVLSLCGWMRFRVSSR